MGNRARLSAAAPVAILTLFCVGAAVAGGHQAAGWLSLAAGCGSTVEYGDVKSLDATAIAIGASIQPCDTILSLRYTELGSDDVSGDIALLLERLWGVGNSQVIGGIGFGLLYHESPRPSGRYSGDRLLSPNISRYEEAGPVWHLQLSRPVSRDVRAGLEWFGAIHDAYGFWGIALVLDIGRLDVEGGRCDP